MHDLETKAFIRESEVQLSTLGAPFCKPPNHVFSTKRSDFKDSNRSDALQLKSKLILIFLAMDFLFIYLKQKN